MPTQPGTTTTQPDLDDLADLDALTDELNRLGFPALPLTPPGKAPYVDVSPPDNDMAPGEPIYVQAAVIIARTLTPASHPQPATARHTTSMTTHEGTSTMGSQAHDSAELQQLADALTRHGYHAAVITPAPYLAIHLPGATTPYMIYSTGGRYWWHTPQTIAPTSQAARAAELITWGLRAHPHGPTPHPRQGRSQEC